MQAEIMGIKDIVVQLDTAPPSNARLQVAIDLARRHDAHLIGIHAVDVLRRAGLAAGSFGSGNGVAIAMLINHVREEALQAASGIEAHFREQMRREGVEGEWRLVEDDTADTPALHARYADLAVLGQEEGSESVSVVERVLFSSGCPCLVVPYAGQFRVGERVIVGWNASREAARAVCGALPLLAGAKSVTVLAINPRRGVNGDGDVPAADITLHLARHGVQATEAHIAAAHDRAGADVALTHARRG